MNLLKHALCAAVLYGVTMAAFALQEGVEYTTLTLSARDLATVQALKPKQAKAAVVELYSFGCGACSRFESSVASWQQTLPAGVTFKKVPVVYSPSWETYAKTQFVLESLGAGETQAQQVFDAIHKQHTALADTASMSKFLASLGHDKAKVDALFASFTLDRDVKNAQKYSNLLQANSVPVLVVITDKAVLKINNSTSAGTDGMLSIASELLAGKK